MVNLLLAVIYAAFISLGLPDALLGSAWPSMYKIMDVPVSYAGVVSMIISCGTVISSFMSDRVVRKLGTHLVSVISVALTALGLFGFSVSGTFWQLCVWAVPYGLGAGSIDAALNNYVALHYSSAHMNWLHCFWGLGAMAGPYIMGACLTNGLPFGSGYRTVFYIQIVLTVVLILSRPLWKKDPTAEAAAAAEKSSLRRVLKMPGAPLTLFAFFLYCALESTTGLWASSYLVLQRGTSAETAATMASLFYIGITAGRFFGGFVSGKLGDRRMVAVGITLALCGTALLFIPVELCAFIGLIFIGVGCAPIYPGLLHQTPVRFGAQNAQAIMGMQMACAYIGSMTMPALFGKLSDFFGMQLYPTLLLAFAGMLAFAVWNANRLTIDHR